MLDDQFIGCCKRSMQLLPVVMRQSPELVAAHLIWPKRPGGKPWQPLRMLANIKLLLAILVLMFPISLQAQTATQPDEQTLQIFVREGCPHCADAKAYLPTLTARHPQLQIVLRAVDEDPAAMEDLLRYSAQAGITAPGVPTFLYQDRVLVGFTSPAQSGPSLEQLLNPAGSGLQEVESGLFGTLNVERLGLPLFTLALGLLDGFNPCAMWVLLFLLSLLVHLHDRRRMALIAGTFVLVSGLVYFAFMAAWLNLFLAVGLTTTVQLLLGLVALVIGAINVKDFVRPGYGVSLSIPDSAKPGLFARMRRVMAAETTLFSLAAVATLAVVVNFIELLCTAGFPAIYTAVLTSQGLEQPAYYGYLGLYILGYIFDDSVMVGTAVIALSNRKLTENAGRWLKLLSGVVMLLLGLILMFRPDLLL